MVYKTVKAGTPQSRRSLGLLLFLISSLLEHHDAKARSSIGFQSVELCRMFAPYASRKLGTAFLSPQHKSDIPAVGLCLRILLKCGSDFWSKLVNGTSIDEKDQKIECILTNLGIPAQNEMTDGNKIRRRSHDTDFQSEWTQLADEVVEMALFQSDDKRGDLGSPTYPSPNRVDREWNVPFLWVIDSQCTKIEPWSPPVDRAEQLLTMAMPGHIGSPHASRVAWNRARRELVVESAADDIPDSPASESKSGIAGNLIQKQTQRALDAVAEVEAMSYSDLAFFKRVLKRRLKDEAEHPAARLFYPVYTMIKGMLRIGADHDTEQRLLLNQIMRKTRLSICKQGLVRYERTFQKTHGRPVRCMRDLIPMASIYADFKELQN